MIEFVITRCSVLRRRCTHPWRLNSWYLDDRVREIQMIKLVMTFDTYPWYMCHTHTNTPKLTVLHGFIYSQSHVGWHFRKEPYIYSKEPHVHSNEPYIHSKEPYIQPIPRAVTFSKALSKLKAPSSNVSFHWNVGKRDVRALSFQNSIRKRHPQWERGGGLGLRPIFKKFNKPYAPS